jgi:hypothetical protein
MEKRRAKYLSSRGGRFRFGLLESSTTTIPILFFSKKVDMQVSIYIPLDYHCRASYYSTDTSMSERSGTKCVVSGEYIYTKISKYLAYRLASYKGALVIIYN